AIHYASLSFPTRRSSDLGCPARAAAATTRRRQVPRSAGRVPLGAVARSCRPHAEVTRAWACPLSARARGGSQARQRGGRACRVRSEEHTSELQSRETLVC